jgi:hypothetical protein
MSEADLNNQGYLYGEEVARPTATKKKRKTRKRV